MATATPRSTRAGIISAMVAIAIFGAIYGTLVRPTLGSFLTVATSALVFSGSVQFAIAGVMLAGGSIAALLMTAAALNLRNILLGAVIRPHLSASRLRRAVAAWFLIDETLGFAIAARRDAARMLVRAGIACYAAWLGGTVVGVAGGSLAALQPVAEAVFPVLFIGLAALAATTRDLVIRSMAAAALTIGIAALWPAGRGLIPVVVALAVALPGLKR